MVKWRRSRVAMFTALNLSAIATTMASAVPRGKLEYCSTSSAALLVIVVFAVRGGDHWTGVDDDHAPLASPLDQASRTICFERVPRSGSPSKMEIVRNRLRGTSPGSPLAHWRSISTASASLSSGTSSTSLCFLTYGHAPSVGSTSWITGSFRSCPDARASPCAGTGSR
jgi:hypothetical protein